MQLIPVTELEPGMRVGRSLYDPYGHRLIARGYVLDANVIAKIRALGFKVVYIDDGRDEIELNEVVREETRAAAVAALHRFAASAAARPTAFTKVMEGTIDSIVAEILSAESVVVALAQMKAMVDQLFNHSVNVAILSLMAGHRFGFTRSQLRNLGVGALLHDMGKILVPPVVLNKEARLTPEELAFVRQIPERGAELVRKANLGAVAAAVVHQHQERWDGSGYPRGLRGEQIYYLARMCAVCDVFDSLTSDRPHRPAQSHAEALAYLEANAGVLFDLQMVKALTQVVVPYPIATHVKLSSGDVGVVVRIHHAALDRPVVRLVRGPEGMPYPAGDQGCVDLAERPDLAIERAVPWYELIEAISRWGTPRRR